MQALPRTECVSAARVLLAGTLLLAPTAAMAAKPPTNGTYFVVAMGLAERYGIQAECFTFTASELCTLDGEICGTWQALETEGKETSFGFELFALDEGTPVKLEGVGRVDSRGKKSAIGGAGRGTGLGPPANFSFAGRQTGMSNCLSLLERFVGGEQEVVNGSGNVVTESRDVTGFSGVILGGVGRLVVDHTGSESLSITAEDNILPLLRSEVSGNRLILGPAPDTSLSTTRPIIYRLTVRDLEELVAAGATEIEIDGIDTTRFTVNSSGVSSIKVSGRTDRQDLTLSGTSEYKARNLDSRIATVDVSGLARAVIRVSERLSGVVSGFGLIEYLGDPQVDVKISGFGEVKKSDD